jgi:hypothetical protein
MKLIKLTQGKFAQVDDEDYEYLNQWKWYTTKHYKNYYATRNLNRKIISMHRVIMNTPDDKEVDHIDHNGLNCQKYNMRNCIHAENMANRFSCGRSKYLGVYYQRNKYKDRIYEYIVAQIGIKDRNIYIGRFKTEKDAALAYDKKAIELFGEFATLNF